MAVVYELTPEEVAQALEEAKARGLPDGWDVKLDKRKRRKWISPNGRTVDSIPKALAMSVEMGLISADSIVDDSPMVAKHYKRQHSKQPKSPSASAAGLEIPEEVDVSIIENIDYKALDLPPPPVIPKRGPGRPSKKAKMQMLQQQKWLKQYQILHAQAQARAKQKKHLNHRPHHAARQSKKVNYNEDAQFSTLDDDDEGQKYAYKGHGYIEIDEVAETVETDKKPKAKPQPELKPKTKPQPKPKATPKAKKPRQKEQPKVVASKKQAAAPVNEIDEGAEEDVEEEEEDVSTEDESNNEEESVDDDDDDDIDDDSSMERPTDPETALQVGGSHLTTVHWHPNSNEGRKIGWRVRLADNNADDWKSGRIMRYDPCTHRHKIQFHGECRSTDRVDEDNCAWVHLRTEDGVQIATKLVWAHVRGYAWWPAMTMDSDGMPTKREGQVTVEFFGTAEVATLRECPEAIRPFINGQVDDVIAKNKKKRNVRALQLAIEEEEMIHRVRNDAVLFYAEQAFLRNAHAGASFVGKRVQIFRDDVNYPYGDTVTGRVKQSSMHQKRWLISYDLSPKARTKHDASWINLLSKEHKTRMLDKKSSTVVPTDTDILPFLVGFRYNGDDEDMKDPEDGTDANIAKLLKERCCGCAEYKKESDMLLECTECNGSFHIGCVDPPISKDDYQRLLRSGDFQSWKCSKCTPCRGCYQRDIAFGSHCQLVPSTLSFPDNESFDLCSMCVNAYEKKQYCPNCAHSWDDEHYQQVQRQINWLRSHRPKKRGRKRKHEDSSELVYYDEGTFSAPATTNLDDTVLPLGAKVNPTWYFPETAQWGYTEVDMLTCDSCKLWVHAGCAGLNEDEYDATSNGQHPIYGKEFLCRECCRKRAIEIVQKLQSEDSQLFFAEPVTDLVAKNYLDVIKHPMDLRTLAALAHHEEYGNYAWVRDKFELIVFNALTFNPAGSKIWSEAKRFHNAGLLKVFSIIGKAAPPSQYFDAIQQKYKEAEVAKKKEEDRIQQDESTEKKDLVGGSKVVTLTLPDLRDAPPDQGSCMAFREVMLKPSDRYYASWMDCCFTCGSSGASDTMLFCVDCGEAFHSFCVNAPIHSMDAAAVASWRCPNCKICEISGDDPQDELKMLFCEMCDRAFSLDLLDPPLQSAPSGLWICGQCVDCEKCNNESEPRGASLTHWSRDPRICFRCGGCDGLLESSMKGRKCPICTKMWRDGDTDIAECEECGIRVHGKCDVRANIYLLKQNSEIGNASSDKANKYTCPTCSKKHGNTDFGRVTRDHMHELSWQVIIQGILKPGVESSHLELQEKLMSQVDWKTRNLYRDEYRKVVLEGVRFLDMAREQYGDPRLLMDRFWRENLDLPTWMGQRATRFIHIAKRLKLTSQGFSARRIENCVLISKLAASWLKVACRTLGINTKKNVKGYERARKLLVPPDKCGALLLPFDNIRCERNRNIINKDEWSERFEPELKPFIDAQVLNLSDEADADGNGKKSRRNTECEYKLAKPLCGWNDLIEADPDRGDNEWKDPRQCSLCHMCGDDDAGLPGVENCKSIGDDSDLKVARVGRLLPFGDGNWVHAMCAFWSSETWLTPSGGFMNAMEKARSRGAQLKCFGCGRSGATVGCSKANCPCNYHFPCAFAMGCVFTKDHKVFCAQHKDVSDELRPHPSEEYMKTLIVAPDKSKQENVDSQLCTRIGALVVHSMGQIERHSDCFHTEDYITTKGYLSSRIFWSTVTPKKRTVYMLKIEEGENHYPVFSATPGDRYNHPIKGTTADEVYKKLVSMVEAANRDHYSQGDLYSKLPTKRLSRKRIFGLNGAQFFGFGLSTIRRALETLPGSESLATPMTDASPRYRFCYNQPSMEAITVLQRERAVIAAEKELENTSGCARTEGTKAVARSGGSGRITRALVRSADAEQVGGDGHGRRVEEESTRLDRSVNQKKYRDMKSVPIEQRLVAKRSHIHGWGLFTKVDFPKDSMVVEYMGETVRRCMADKREKAYEVSGEGSCYMFRLDLLRIVDATDTGCMARFMNHSCQPNAYAKVITVETDLGHDKKIMIFAKRDIATGEEITYDYKFPVEDGSLRCTCGAPNCIGRLN
eukprot:CAMPEP_0119546822 /NCGR_PEP_ID=MMETSP1352-20130426/1064_1 /TAXON_ID=265584 /ORGANISM="Stauroneis constricta, Strain CCMP1120" /LENGTH=2084 /DNA_ID=CAMNT_0007591549 /DNA_START=81 /DNA_END=6335 /DNA_ORIENTATION=-